jgi:hypothetical protein
VRGGDQLNAHLKIVKCKMGRVLPPPPLKLDVTESCLKKPKYLKRRILAQLHLLEMEGAVLVIY